MTAARSKSLFDTVLVANRGEIACRIISTLRRMGIRSVAVYSDADAGARHVREADLAVRIGPAPAAESYLRIEAILQACRETGAQAVHPGYGFLSENAGFARALADAGITFIGPGVEPLNIMGDKIRSKNHVSGYGVPVIPGIAEPGLDNAQLAAAAAGVGFPLLIKPSAGGGGKGMHIVERPEDLPAALAAARRVAAGAFGDDTLFLERLVPAPRHIEVQVLADRYGNTIHLGERECSLQRRHQKVIEEAPSPLLEGLADGGAIRARIGEAACQAARSVNYSGAGTVEFLVSDEAPEEFFFMEMNTRLQVEHPVTEMVTGVDLVEWQVRIAAGEELALGQDDVVLTGHAVEGRVYAEIPQKNFLPSTGHVLLLDELPGSGQRPGADAGAPGGAAAGVQVRTARGRVRVDSALAEGLEISSSYDPMIAKVIAWGADRTAALDTLDDALAGYTVLGVDTNVEYLRLLVNDDEVRAGRLHTGLIERRMPGFRFRQVGEFELVAAALYALAVEKQNRPAAPGPWQRRDGWRLGAPAPRRISLGTPGGGIASVAVTGNPDAAGVLVAVDGGPPRAAVLDVTAHPHAVLTLDGETRRYSLAPVFRGPAGLDWGNPGPGPLSELYLGHKGWSCRLELLGREAELGRLLAAIERDEGAADPAVRSPMPGTVVSVSVADGEPVQAGQVLLSVEAMKMEHQLLAPLDGTVHIGASPGDLVKAGQVLATIHAREPGPAPARTGGAGRNNGGRAPEAAPASGAAEEPGQNRSDHRRSDARF